MHIHVGSLLAPYEIHLTYAMADRRDVALDVPAPPAGPVQGTPDTKLSFRKHVEITTKTGTKSRTLLPLHGTIFKTTYGV